MGVFGQIRSRIEKILVSNTSRRLEAEGRVKRAPTFALLAVEPSQLALFEQQISQLSKRFDRVIALWPKAETPRKLPANVELVELSSNVTSRWHLIEKCSDGFVFPISLLKPLQADHVSHLKQHLFAIGGANLVALHKFDWNEATEGVQAEHDLSLIPVPIVDPDYAIFDQRFWKLGGDAFVGENEAVALAGQARARQFGMVACNDLLAESVLPRIASHSFERLDLVEQVVRSPRLVKAASPATLGLWASTWDALGAKFDKRSSSELQETLREMLERNKSFSDDPANHVKTLVGKTTRQRGQR